MTDNTGNPEAVSTNPEVVVEVVELVIIANHVKDPAGPPEGKTYEVVIDGQPFRFHESHPEGNEVMERVGKKPCQHKLFQVLCDQEEIPIGTDEHVDLRRPGTEQFRTETRHEVIVYVKFDSEDRPVSVHRGEVEIATLRQRADIPDSYAIYVPQKDGPPLPAADTQKVLVEGCEVFPTQLKTGGSS